MSEQVEISLGERKIGTAQIVKEGLYYRISCRCKLSGEVMYQLKAICTDKECSLGICVPIGDQFGVDTRIPVKKLGVGQISILAVPRHSEVKGRFVPIRADEPFSYIEMLQKSHLELRNGQQGIWVREQ